MRSLYTVALALSAWTLSAQTPFQRIYPTPTSQFTYGGTVDQEGHFLILQESPDNDVLLSRMAPNGDLVWTKSYPLFTEEGFYGKSIVATDDGGILVLGYTMGFGTLSRDAFVMKLDLDGNILSQQRVHAGASSNAYHSLHKGTNGYFASGRATGTSNYDMLLARIEEDGTTTWSRSYGGSSNPEHWDWARGATQLSDGGYAVVGFGDGIGTTATSGYLVRTDASGNELWARVVSSGVSSEDINAVVEGTNGDIYLGGRGLGFIPGDVSAFIIKLNSAGTLQWTRVLQRGIEVADLHPGPDGGVTWLARPQFLPDGAGGYEIGWGQMDANGNSLRMRIYGDAGNESADNMEPLPGGGWAIFGHTNSHSNGPFSPFILVIDAEGNSDCWEIHPDMAWTNVTAVVTPLTSTTGDSFESFPMTTGNATVDMAAPLDPCCAIIAEFEPLPGHTSLQWTFNNTSTGGTSYSWDFGDGTTSTEQSPAHAFATAGAYNVCLTVTADCGAVTTCIVVSTNVGVDDLQGSALLQVFPVPAHDRLTLRSAQRIGQTRVLDAAGRVVLVTSGAMRNELVIATDALPKGVYMIEALLGDGQLVHSRAVVAH